MYYCSVSNNEHTLKNDYPVDLMWKPNYREKTKKKTTINVKI